MFIFLIESLQIVLAGACPHLGIGGENRDGKRL